MRLSLLRSSACDVEYTGRMPAAGLEEGRPSVSLGIEPEKTSQ